VPAAGPAKEQDAQAAYMLGQLGCTGAEIAALFGVSDELVRKRSEPIQSLLGS
jgi:hypothetical protein